MARQARVKSETGIYHIMHRGIDKRNIFIDDEDKMMFIKGLLRAKRVGKFELYAYCLMSNHVHLLMREKESIGKSMQRIAVSYVTWHNNKHGRTGHLFQNRYLSEPVETEAYFVTVLRYIHQNPIKAGLVKMVKDYPWSSYREYELAYQGKKTHVNAHLAQSYFKTFKTFGLFINEPNSDQCLDYRPTQRITDHDLLRFVNTEYSKMNIAKLDRNDRNKVIKDLYRRTGASIRQIARVLGVGKHIVENAIDKRSSKRADGGTFLLSG